MQVKNHTTKKIASFIEIYIFLFIFLCIIIRVFIKYNINDNIIKNKSTNQIVTGSVINQIKNVFKPYIDKFNNIFMKINKILSKFTSSINIIRNLTRPIRLFFRRIANSIFIKIENFMTTILYVFHKLRNNLKRSLSGFNLILHTVFTIRYFMESIINSPLIGIANDVLPHVPWITGSMTALMALCFDENTKINTNNGYLSIKDILPGMILEDNNVVISTHKILNKNIMYNLNNIIVSGSHLVYFDNKWNRVRNINKSIKILDYNKKYIYCINTTKGILKINNIIFKDFSETNNFILNFTINKMILKKLNNNKNILNISIPKYLEQGMAPCTKIYINHNEFKLLKDINIGDNVFNGTVIAKIKIDINFLDTYIYKNKYILSGNIKIQENNLWINVADSKNSKKINTNSYKYFYHLITTNQKLYLDINTPISDYLECHDLKLNKDIDNMVEKYYNL